MSDVFIIVYVMSVDILFLSIPIPLVKAVDCGVELCGLSCSYAFKTHCIWQKPKWFASDSSSC